MASIKRSDANRMMAPRTADGRYWIGAVRNSRINAMVPKATRPLTWLVARIESFTAVRDPLAPIGMPWLKPEATLATPKASSSWSASTVSRCFAANDRAVRIASAKLTRKIAKAGRMRAESALASTSGRARSGNPAGTGPVRVTP